LEKIGTKPKESLHVGDSLISDYRGAKAAGLRAVLIDRENKKAEDNNIIKIKSLIEIEKFLGK